jgi:acyl-CoA synthetase (AMP-forming)/AMP-acid ligase II
MLPGGTAPAPGWLDWLSAPRSGTGIHLTTAAGRQDYAGYDRLGELVICWRSSAGWEDADHRDSVLVVATPSVAMFAAFYGLLSGGANVCLIAPPAAITDRDAYQQHLRAALDAVGPRLVLCEQQLVTAMTRLVASAGQVTLIPLQDSGLPDPEAMARIRLARAAGPGDLLQLTSGSSGASRCVQLSPDAVASNVAAIADWLAVTSADVGVSWLPLYHDMGLIGCFLMPVSQQIELHLLDPAQFVRRPASYLSYFGRGSATISAVPPFGLDFITRRVKQSDLAGMDMSAWRAVITGAERIPMEVLDRYTELLAPYGFQASALCPAYGLAEATLAVTGSPPGQEPGYAKLPGEPDRRYVSCGRPLPGMSVRVVDSSGREVTGEPGEVVVSSPSMARGYRGTPSRSTRFEGNELWTGDAGFIVGGELHIVGRLGDAVKIRGRWLFAEDLEALFDHPAFRDGRAVVAVGQQGETVRVLLVCERRLDLDTGVLDRYLRTQGITAVITVVPVIRRDIPRTSSGKPRRRMIWLQYADEAPGSAS